MKKKFSPDYDLRNSLYIAKPEDPNSAYMPEPRLLSTYDDTKPSVLPGQLRRKVQGSLGDGEDPEVKRRLRIKRLWKSRRFVNEEES